MPSRDSDTDSHSDEADEALTFYKSQIQQLESELSDFQASSRELEQELERELEASEKQHQELRDKNEGLRYEVEEWKTKYKQSKSEANSAQNILQKEVTTLRETNRTLQLRLRDIEVSNDDFERKERIVKSSLEDLESKYNVSIERGVMLEQEIQIGEQEREALRIECQRLRDELSDLKVEQEITVEKLNNAMAMAAKYGNGSLHHVPPPVIYQSSLSETSSDLSRSPTTPTTVPSISTSTPQSDHGVTPPSPPMSEVSTTPSNSSRHAGLDPTLTPRPSHYQRSRYTRKPSIGSGVTRLYMPLPPSKSLHQIRGLIGQMQRLEQRVQNARSKLPNPSNGSPRSSTVMSPAVSSFIPPSVTMRNKKRPSSNASSVTSGSGSDIFQNSNGGRLSYSQIDRPVTRAALERPSSRMNSRPESRASGTTSRSSTGMPGMERPSGIPQRPVSRQSMSGRATAMGTHADFGTSIMRRDRERSSFGSNPGDDLFINPTGRRNTFSKHETGSRYSSGIPQPPSALPRRSIGGTGTTMTRRASTAAEIGNENGLALGLGLKRPGKQYGVGGR
ncbi:NADH:ubiquinone oxidoreductase [Rhizina undulata]